MRLKPFTGQVLVELIPPETKSDGGIDIPDRCLSAEEVQDRHRTPEATKPPGIKAKVVEIGPWPKLANGLTLMPEFGKGATVIIAPHTGVELAWETSCRLRLLWQDDIQAVLSS